MRISLSVKKGKRKYGQSVSVPRLHLAACTNTELEKGE